MTSTTSSQANRRQGAEDESDNYEARLKAAGLDGEDPEDLPIDEFRARLTRRIAMFLNEWQGCPQRICHRNHGCMAPTGDCANLKDVEMSEEEWAQCRFDIRQALDERMAEAGLKDE